MAVLRVVPDITSEAIPASREFYGLLGLEETMDLGWVVILAAPGRPEVQLILMGPDARLPSNQT